MTRVLIVDDHAVFRRGVESILNGRPGWEVCGMAESGEQAIELTNSAKPDVIVMDLTMPGMSGLEATRSIRRDHPQIRVLLLTLHNAFEYMKLGFQVGARGYLLKSEAEGELLRALEAIVNDELYVSPSFDAKSVERIRTEHARDLGNTAH